MPYVTLYSDFLEKWFDNLISHLENRSCTVYAFHFPIVWLTLLENKGLFVISMRVRILSQRTHCMHDELFLRRVEWESNIYSGSALSEEGNSWVERRSLFYCVMRFEDSREKCFVTRIISARPETDWRTRLYHLMVITKLLLMN